jgi:putative ABC transport system ATP-binding protein
VLEVLNISKSFSKSGAEVKVLEEVSIKLDAGGFLAVRGASGCGKTTFLLTLGALLAPDRGEVVLDGKSVYNLKQEERAQFRAEQIGFVFQQFHLMPYLNVIDNIMTPALVVKKSGLRERCDSLIKQFGLGHRVDHFPSELSVGERQRTALARALLLSPRLLLADEPTGNLDPENSQMVLEALRQYATDGNCVIMVTHNQDAAEKADNVFEL